MSFSEARSDIQICNRALSRIGQTGLTGSLLDPINQNKNAGRECNLHYKPTVRRLLEQHHWNLATKRETLVANVTNDRSLEWGYSYVPPSDMAFPVNVYTPGSSTVPVSYYHGIQGLLAKAYGRPLFLHSGGALYSMLAPAELEFTSFAITEQDFTQELEDVVVLFLAAKLAYSVAKNHDMGNDIKQEAIKELNSIIANNLNQQGQRYGDTPSEGELVREGGYEGILPYGLSI